MSLELPNLKETISSESCNDFRSGDSKRKQADYCDVSGVFGSVCNHGFIFGLMNISKGESLTYSLAMISEIRKHLPRRKISIAYDIFCRIANNPKCEADFGFIPEMHSLNHNDPCQSKFSPKRILGIGHEDGEDSERAWAYLRFLAASTSVMRKENREDVITFVWDAYNESLLFRLVEKLKNDVKRCRINISDLMSRLFIEDVKPYTIIVNELLAANLACRTLPVTEIMDAKSRFIKAMLPDVRKFNILKSQTMRKGNCSFFNLNILILNSF